MSPRHVCPAAWLLLTIASLSAAAAVWEPQPAPSNAPLVPERVRIVKQGMEHARSGDGYMFTISGLHRSRYVKDPVTGLWDPLLARDDYREYHDFDVNGNGQTNDDSVGCHPYSLAVDNPLTPIAPYYDTSVGCQRFYGGMTIYHANISDTGYSEDGLNMGEEGVGNQPRRNWTYFHETFEPLSPFRMYMLALWQKHDFMNGGAQYNVTFDTQSELAYLIMRYHMGMEGFRWVIRDGEQLYISELVFRGAGEPYGTTGGKAHVLRPQETRWALYNPAPPYTIDFPTNTTYAPHTFANVTAIGWYLFKDKLIPGYIGHKWYAVEADALVHRPARPSESIAMVGMNASPAFYIATCETPYRLWRKVHRLGRSNTFVRDPRGCVFNKNGDMGSMDFPDAAGNYLAHGQDEPVTDVTLYDVLAWCNALSVQESKEACYYVDATFTNAFREVLRSPCYKQPYAVPTIYVKWGASGYRLPTPAEWQIALGTTTYRTNSPTTTYAVGSDTTNQYGLYEMLGNAWELVWPYGDALTPAALTNLMVLGGDFHGGAAPTNFSASAYGDQPFSGNYNIGFRLVRRASGLAPPDRSASISNGIPQWVITPGTTTKPVPARQLAAPLATPWLAQVALPSGVTMGSREVTFAEWKPVYDWARTQGYAFDTDGDMGSMAYWGWGTNALPVMHSPSEPVAGVSHNDVLVWLNALSELEGKAPVYYYSTSLAQVCKKAFVYRPLMTLLGEESDLTSSNIIVADRTEAQYGGATTNTPGSWFTFGAKNAANGYRLPTITDFSTAFAAGKGTLYPWGTAATQVYLYAWTLDSSGLTTHPVGTKATNEWGLADMLGNVAEWSHDFSTGYAYRQGASCIDATLQYGRIAVTIRETQRGLSYPDVGFRVVR